MKRWLPFLPACLLTVIAVTQVVTAYTTSLTPWKGGGFGMFSTGDAQKGRQLRLYAVGAKRQEQRIGVPPALRNLARKAGNFPSQENLNGLAREMADRVSEGSKNVLAIRVEIWRGVFDPATSKMTFSKWREAQIGVRH